MLTSFIRTVILLFFVVCAVRIMGKRQIGQLQPAELVVTILLSEIAASPMQDNDIPMGNTIVAILVLTGMEIFLSALNMKSIRLRTLLQGNSVILINDGVLDREQMKKLRFTFDDILEALRQKDVFNIDDVSYAVVETDGTLSVMLKPEKMNLTNGDVGRKPPESGLMSVVIMDGEVIHDNFKNCNMTEEKLSEILDASGLRADEILLLTINKQGEKSFILKENEQ